MDVRAFALALAVGAGVRLAAAQEAPPPAEPPSFEELQAMIARMQQRVESLGQTAAERDKALEFLSQQVDKAAGQISGTGQTNDSLRGQTAVLSDQVEGLSAERDRLAGEAQNRAGELDQIRSQIATLEQALGAERTGKADLEQELGRARTELASLRASLEGEQRTLAGSADALNRARFQIAALNDALEEERSSRQAALGGLAAAEERVRGLEQELAQTRGALAAELDRLRGELQTARGENEALRARLAGVETEDAAKGTRIADLDRQLKQALAQQVEELSQYRSEFFGRLRQLLGERPDIRVVGDRFVFQSELLFASGSATLDPKGTAALRELAQSLREVTASIPSDLDWVLRVDGHTDRLPIRVGPFVSNWELSVARAISVVEFLIREGIPPDRLAAAGFGEFRPLDTRDDEIAYRRNRRIEFKLTEG